MSEEIIWVDENDNQIGTGEKMDTHRKGILHRAFSIFVFNEQGQLMIQKRAEHKYHSGGLWTNTCCSHPHPGETVLEAAHTRLMNEMGFDTELTEQFAFQYSTQYKDLSENEYDHVLIGKYNGEPKINTDEVADWKWMSIAEIKDDMLEQPEAYTSWFKIAIERL